MSVDKYPSIFSRQMEAIVYISDFYSIILLKLLSYSFPHSLPQSNLNFILRFFFVFIYPQIYHIKVYNGFDVERVKS